MLNISPAGAKENDSKTGIFAAYVVIDVDLSISSCPTSTTNKEIHKVKIIMVPSAPPECIIYPKFNDLCENTDATNDVNTVLSYKESELSKS